MLYFAYGSNMDWEQMQQRCPSAEFAGIAVLRDRNLAFTRMSRGRGCGVADVVRAPGNKVWGALYEVPDIDIEALDGCEGYKAGRAWNHYWRREHEVFVGDDDSQRTLALVYLATAEANAPLPNRAYVGQLLAGARHWNLPADYIARLEAIATAG